MCDGAYPGPDSSLYPLISIYRLYHVPTVAFSFTIFIDWLSISQEKMHLKEPYLVENPPYQYVAITIECPTNIINSSRATTVQYKIFIISNCIFF